RPGVLTLAGHTRPVNAVCFSPDGTRLATASSDRDVKLWDTHSGKEVLTLSGHRRGVTGVGFSPDGRRLVTGTGLGMVEMLSAAADLPLDVRTPAEVKAWEAGR